MTNRLRTNTKNITNKHSQVDAKRGRKHFRKEPQKINIFTYIHEYKNTKKQPPPP